ncbi:MAG: hypothetical protein KAR06_04125 [Deltaproteobacteria bacterium]|nr:hypothetical protein [Deltaproteobacteria bacterium]
MNQKSRHASLSRRRRGKNNHARFDYSARLQRMYKALKSGRWRSLDVLGRLVRTANVGSTASEMRSNGFDVEQRYNGVLADGTRLSQYRMVRA